MGGNKNKLCEELKPALVLVLVNAGFAGVNIFYKLSINDGMDLKILVAYRYVFAAVTLAPLAFFLERKSRPTMTWTVLMQAFLCGLFGGSLAQNLYVASIKLTSATFASAMTNLIPALTFLLAVLLKMETLGIKTIPGQAKIIGTIVGISGAMVLTLYKGVEVNIWTTHFDLLKFSHKGHSLTNEGQGNPVAGALLVVCSCTCYAIWLNIQAKMSESYPCHYSSTALMCAMAAAQSSLFAMCLQKDWGQWGLGSHVRLISVLYNGVVASALVLTLLSWCISQRGALYASVFNPLMLVIVALLSSLLLKEKLYLGSILGAILIVIGLYFVLWGKGKESAKVAGMPSENREDNTIDIVIVPNKTNNSQEEGKERE